MTLFLLFFYKEWRVSKFLVVCAKRAQVVYEQKRPVSTYDVKDVLQFFVLKK